MAYNTHQREEHYDPEQSRLPLTIMQVLPNLVSGGAERGAVDVAAAIVQAGGRAIIVSNGSGTAKPSALMYELQRAGGEHIELNVASKNPFTIRRNAGTLARLIRQHGVNVIHARSRAPAWSAYRAAQLTGIAFVTTFHAAYKFKSEAKKRYNAVMTKGEPVIAISQFIADHIEHIYGLAPQRIVTIPRGVDVDRFSRSAIGEERMIRLLREWRVPDHLPVLLMPSRLSRIKGHSVLVEALAARKQAGMPQDLYCVIVGATEADARYRAELEQLISERGLEGWIRIVDHCSDMPAAYGLAHLVVAPSTVPEGFGRVPVEAQALGKPVIASDIGGFRETIAQGQTGWLVPPNDPIALAAAIESVMSLGPDERSSLAMRAEQQVRLRFTKGQMCESTLSIYREVTGKRAALSE